MQAIPRLTIVGAVLLAALSVLGGSEPARAEYRLPVLVPITGFLALEGSSQRNGALLALESRAEPHRLTAPVIDTGTTPEGAVTAFDRALDQDGEGGPVIAVVASMLGTQMLAMLPLADEAGVPLVTVSGTAAVTERASRQVFRFFPADPVAKSAHARFVVEARGYRRPAVITQTTAYGQSGRTHLLATFRALGVEPVFEESLDTGVKDMLPVLRKALAAKPDVLVVHLHAGPTALLVRQAAAMAPGLPIVAGSAMHQPATAALLEPAELAGVCAETASSPVSVETPAMADFTTRYRERFHAEPDAFAVGQYDGVSMVLAALAAGADSPAAVRDHLAGRSHDGIAMTYRSDGRGNMAHGVVIICYDGSSRVPRVVRRYDRFD